MKAGYKEMIVDDEPIAVEALKSGVDWASMQVTTVLSAHNTIDAQKLLSRQEVDIVLCDIEMPGASGLELVKFISETYPATVCIFLTCYSEFSYAKQAVSLGVFDYLLKPVDYEELTAILRRAIFHRKELISREKASAVLSDISHRVAEEEPTEAALLETIEMAKAFILDHISDETLNCQTVAQHVYLNSDYLSKVFKAKLNISLKSYIIKVRMSLACQLLTDTELSVSKIAMSCGYTHMAHFSKMFKQETGQTPYEYRTNFKC